MGCQGSKSQQTVKTEAAIAQQPESGNTLLQTPSQVEHKTVVADDAAVEHAPKGIVTDGSPLETDGQAAATAPTAAQTDVEGSKAEEASAEAAASNALGNTKIEQVAVGSSPQEAVAEEPPADPSAEPAASDAKGGEAPPAAPLTVDTQGEGSEMEKAAVGSASLGAPAEPDALEVNLGETGAAAPETETPVCALFGSTWLLPKRFL